MVPPLADPLVDLLGLLAHVRRGRLRCFAVCGRLARLVTRRLGLLARGLGLIGRRPRLGISGRGGRRREALGLIGVELRLQMYTPPCADCGARCCKYVAIHIPTPRKKADFEDIRFYLLIPSSLSMPFRNLSKNCFCLSRLS